MIQSCKSLVPAALVASLLLSCSAEQIFRRKDRSGPMLAGKQFGEWTYRYPESRALQAKGRYFADRQVGPWVYYYENGQVEWQGVFDDQRIHGPTRFNHEDGSPLAAGQYVEGLEEGGWTFWTEAGARDRCGSYVAGRPQLRWTYFHPDGSTLAVGYRHEGERVGLWQFWSADGTLAERSFPLPEGWQIVHETWEDGSPRREGFLAQGQPQGRWVTWHHNGLSRASGDFERGRAQGRWMFWDAQGVLLAVGRMDRGAPAGTWRVTRDGQSQELPASQLSLGRAFAGAWSADSIPESGSVDDALATWLAEATSPVEGVVDASPDPDTPPPSAELMARTAGEPSVPLRPQPWTVREEEALEFLVERYTDGARSARAPSSYGRRGARPRTQRGDVERSSKLLGTQLPWTRFRQADGSVVDLDQFRGEQKVLLVVLRGFSREICVYCATQTKALSQNVDDFERAGCAVFAVYPGERNKLEAFLESYRGLTEEGDVPEIGMLYDPDMRLVQLMDIESEMAIPSTFVVDEGGVLRYAYVGEDIEDRPPVKDVLDAIAKMPRP